MNCFEILNDFWRKIAKRGKLGIWAKQASLLQCRNPRCSVGTHAAMVWVASPRRGWRVKKATPRVCCSVAVLRRGVDIGHSEHIFKFLFRKSSFRTLIV